MVNDIVLEFSPAATNSLEPKALISGCVHVSDILSIDEVKREQGELGVTLRTQLDYIAKETESVIPKGAKFLVHKLVSPGDHQDATNGRVIQMQDFIRINWNEAQPYSVRYHENS